MDRARALKHFNSLNRTRLERLRELAPHQHELVIDLLPLLFHLNSKLLPGYISDDTPFGIIDYRPEPHVLDQAKKYRNGFSYRQRALRRYALRGIYLLGDHGQLSYPDIADYQLWLLHTPQLGQQQLVLLQQKAEAIAEWARQQDMQLQIRLFSNEQIKQQAIPSQQLDQFYANGLILAGAVPLWWLITPEEESDYDTVAEHLVSQRIFNQNSIIDFGQVGQPDAQYTFDKAYQQLLVTMTTGLDSMMELRYQQFCLQQFPNIPSLGSTRKRYVYNEDSFAAAEDITLLKMSCMESALNGDELELTRRSLYSFSKERLSQQVRTPPYPWRRQQIASLVKKWNWSDESIAELDRSQQTRYRRCFTEYQRTTLQLKNFTRILFDFSQKQQLETRSQQQYIQRLQQVQLEPGSDVIMQLPLALRPLPAQQLYLYRFGQNKNWYISDIELKSASQTPLYQDISLLHLLAWAVGNQILARTTWLKVADQTLQVSIAIVMDLVQLLLRSDLMATQFVADRETIMASPLPQQLLLTINLEHQPQDKLSQQGLKITSLQNDPFNYSSARYSQVNTVEGLIRCSWQQWHYFSYAGVDAPLAMMVSILNWHPTNLLRNQIQSWCPTSSYGTAISNRLTRLIDNVLSHYLQYPEQGRYLIQIGNILYRLQWQHGLTEYHAYPAKISLEAALADNSETYTPTYVDSYLDSDGLLNQLLRHQDSEQISVFLYFHQNTITCYLLDELGKLIKHDYHDLSESTLISHFHRFFSAVKTVNNVDRLRFYRLRNEHNNWQISAISIQAKQSGYLPVSVSMKQLSVDASCEIFCGQSHFEGRANDPELFRRVHDLVLHLRTNNLKYPLYLTELNVVDGNGLSAVDYLIQKQKLEHLLNPN